MVSYQGHWWSYVIQVKRLWIEWDLISYMERAPKSKTLIGKQEESQIS